MIYDLIIIGGGPAGCAAAVYAARKRLKTALIVAEWGGQSTVSENIQNWIGTVSISGQELANSLKKHVETYAENIVDIHADETVTNIVKNLKETQDGSELISSEFFSVQTTNGTYNAKTVLITTGSKRRRLNVPGADDFEHKGITYCASCDGPLFADMDVVVIGGGNAGFESAAQLLAYAKSVTLLHHRDTYKADPVTVKRVLENPKMTGILNAELVEAVGDKFLNGLKYRDKISGEIKHLSVNGIFVEIGQIPNTDFLKDTIELNTTNNIVIDPQTQRTSLIGIWAAGDVTNGLYHQNNIAAGDAVRALEDIYVYLKA